LRPRADRDRIDALLVLDLDAAASRADHAAHVDEHRAVVGFDDDLPADEPRCVEVGHLRCVEPVGRDRGGANRESEREKQQRVDGPAFAASHAWAP
jgi:hypothetical protein